MNQIQEFVFTLFNTRVVNIAILYCYWQYCQHCFQYCQHIAILFLNKYWYWYWQYYFEYWYLISTNTNSQYFYHGREWQNHKIHTMLVFFASGCVWVWQWLEKLSIWIKWFLCVENLRDCVINIKSRTVKVFVLLQQYQKSIGIGIVILFWNLYWYWYWQYILQGVLVLVLPILFKSIVNNPV